MCATSQNKTPTTHATQRPSRWLNGWLIVCAYAVGIVLVIGYFYIPPATVEEEGYAYAQVMHRLNTVADAEYLNQQIQQALDQDQLEEALRYQQLADLLQVTLPEATLLRIAEENTLLNNAWRNTASFGSGFITGEADNTAGFAGAVTADFTLVGDVRDAFAQTKNYLNGEPVDEFIYALSIVGIGMTVATVASVGTAAPARVGVSVLKAAKKTGQLSSGLVRNLGKILRETVDTKTFRNNVKDLQYRDVGRFKDEVARLFKTAKTDRIQTVFSDVKKISDATSATDTIKILKYADNTDDIRRLGKLSGDFGSNTLIVLKVLGKGALKLTKVIAKSIYHLLAMLLSLLYAVLATFLGFFFKLRLLLRAWRRT